MEPFVEKEEATTTSQLAGILSGDPPKVNLVNYGAGRNGVKRHLTQQVPVLDQNLFARLQREVKVGDHIRATVINEYRETGSVVYLADFHKSNEAVPSNITQNGKGSLITNVITEVKIPSRSNTKTKVRL